VKDLIRALARRGKTVILSSHLLSDVEDVCDRVVIYYGGKIQAAGSLRELLVRPDSIRITTPVLPKEKLQRVMELIRADVAEDKVRIDNPTQNLESYFLDVVQRARAAESQTSGATSGNKVAEYLRGEAESGNRSEALLDRLTLPTETPTPVLATPTPPTESIDHQKLAGLSGPAAAPAPVTAEKAAELEKANEKLSSLLGKPK
jgi:ABC-2 type transport system ATP-binding protein